MSGPHITVVTRTCDRPEKLARAARGLRAQTIPFEWVVVQDGAIPIDSAVLSGVGDRQTVLNPTQKLGLAKAAHAGLDAASGDFLMLHDDDDTLLPTALETLSCALEAAPDCVAVTCGYEVWHESEGAAPSCSETASNALPLRFYDLCERNTILTIGTLFRAETYRAIGGVRTDILALEDWDLWIRFMQRGDILRVPDVLARQFIRPASIAGSPQANSLKEDHHRAHILLQNAYLREDIAAGRIGLGALTHRPHAQFVAEVDDRLQRAGHIKRKLMPWRIQR